VAYARYDSWIKDFPPAADRDCPRISLIFAARDEEEKLATALATLTAIDYPNLEIIAGHDRSQITPRNPGCLRWNTSAIRVAHIDSLPVGWLGKTHALQTGYERSTGECYCSRMQTSALLQMWYGVPWRLMNERRLITLLCLATWTWRVFWEKDAITFLA